MEHVYGTVRDELVRGIKAIDEEFVDGYAQDHPELVGAYMIAAALREVAQELRTNLPNLRS